MNNSEIPQEGEVLSATPEVTPNDFVEAVAPSEEINTLPEQNLTENPEEILSPGEDLEFLEQGEPYEVAEALAEHRNKTDGTTYTAEDIMNGPESATWVSQLMEKHPKARKALQIFALSTALAGAAVPQEAKADVVGDIVNTVAQGFLQQGSHASRQQLRAYQQQDRRYIQLEQQQMNIPAQKQRIYDTYEQKRADLRHRNEMKMITDPNVRAEAELNYQEQRALRNVDIRARQGEQRWVNQDQIANMRANTQIHHTGENIQLNTVNRVIQQGTNDFLRQILTGR